MSLHQQLREALETQVLESDPRGSAARLERAIMDAGAVEVGDGLLDLAAVALRRMVIETDSALSSPDLLSQLTLDGAVSEDHIELLTDTMLMAAATAGGIRPSVEALITRVGLQDAMFGLWLGLLTVVRVTAMVIDATEVEVVEEILNAISP